MTPSIPLSGDEATAAFRNLGDTTQGGVDKTTTAEIATAAWQDDSGGKPGVKLVNPEDSVVFPGQDGVSVASARDKLWKLRDAMLAAFAERDDAVEALLLAFVLQEHVVFEGPPGSAKSMCVDALMSAVRVFDGSVADAGYTRRLMHKFCTIDELVGPMDLVAFQKHGIFQRVLRGGAAACSALFLDEIFKSNAAVLNTLLTLLEEREYADQAGAIAVPLRMCASASNEFPQDDSLAALYDRFLLRHRVHYIQARATLKELLKKKATQSKNTQKFRPPVTLTLAEWDAMSADVDHVSIPDAILEAYLDLRQSLKNDNLTISDRRNVKSLRVLKGAAWLDGDNEVNLDHLQVLRHVFWDTPEQEEALGIALKRLDRSATGKVLDAIDNALRAYMARPTSADEYYEAIPEILGKIKDAGKFAKQTIAEGNLTKRGIDKITRRGKELQAAHKALTDDFSKHVQL